MYNRQHSQQTQETTMEAMHIQNWLDENLTEAVEHITESVEAEYEVTPNVNEIPHESYSGFIPFTNGGITIMAHLSLDYLVGTGKGFVNEDVTKQIDDTVDYCYTGAREQFIEENREALSQAFTKKELDENSDNINYHSLYELKYGELAESLSETETAWLESTLFIEHRFMFFSADNSRNITGRDEIYFISGVNLDYDYGRDKGLVETFEATYAVDDLTPYIVRELVKNMVDSI
jgi:hypothetical protein